MDVDCSTEYQLADAAFHRGDCYRARDLFSQVIQRTDDDCLLMDSLCGRLRCSMALRDTMAALDDVNDIISRRDQFLPHNEKILIAVAYFCSGRVEEAYNMLKKDVQNSTECFSSFLEALWEIVELWHMEMSVNADEIQILNDDISDLRNKMEAPEWNSLKTTDHHQQQPTSI